MLYGYVRISTEKQNMERQVRNIKKEYPNAVIVKEIYTGTKKEGRKEYLKLLKKAKKGDVIIFDSVSRMSRDAAEGIEDYMELFNKGIELVFLKEPMINTASYSKALDIDIPESNNEIANIYLQATKEVLKIIATEQIKVAFAQSEKEVNDLKQRTSEGVKTAQLNGKQVGRKEGQIVTTKKYKIAKEIMLKRCKCFGGNKIDLDVIAEIKRKLEKEHGVVQSIDPKTYYKYKKLIKEELKEEQLLKEKELGIMQGQMDIDDVEAKLEDMDKVTKATAHKGAVDESNNTSNQTVEESNLCKSSAKDEVKVTKKKPKSTKTVDKDYDMGEIAKALEEALEEDNQPKDHRKESLRDYCLRKYSPKDVKTITNVRNWLQSKETKRVQDYWNCKDDELANLLLELEIKVKASNKLIKHFYIDTNGNLAYWFI